MADAVRFESCLGLSTPSTVASEEEDGEEAGIATVAGVCYLLRASAGGLAAAEAVCCGFVASDDGRIL